MKYTNKDFKLHYINGSYLYDFEDIVVGDNDYEGNLEPYFKRIFIDKVPIKSMFRLNYLKRCKIEVLRYKYEIDINKINNQED